MIVDWYVVFESFRWVLVSLLLDTAMGCFGRCSFETDEMPLAVDSVGYLPETKVRLFCSAKPKVFADVVVDGSL